MLCGFIGITRSVTDRRTSITDFLHTIHLDNFFSDYANVLFYGHRVRISLTSWLYLYLEHG